MLYKIGLSVVWGVVAYLGCILVGTLFVATKIPLASIVGNFAVTYAFAISILVAVWYFFTH